MPDWGDKEKYPKWKNRTKPQKKDLKKKDISNLSDAEFKTDDWDAQRTHCVQQQHKRRNEGFNSLKHKEEINIQP